MYFNVFIILNILTRIQRSEFYIVKGFPLKSIKIKLKIAFGEKSICFDTLAKKFPYRIMYH